jgi:NAD(P)-dependent dehydrogenase (short-subunit alcohol dehydrogenase family)
MSDSQKPLTGQVALVTGGGRGLGRAMAQALAEAGASVTITARSKEQLEQTAALLKNAGHAFLALEGDVTNPHSVEEIVRRTEQEWGSIDILVNNAGALTGLGYIWETDPQDWWHDMEVNVRGPYLYARAVLPGMLARKRGRIINIVSRSGIMAMPAQSAYNVSKAALIRLTENIAGEAKEAGISAFALSPGAVPTTMSLHMADFREHQFQQGDAFRALLTDAPEQSADAVVWLAMGQGDALTGRYISAKEDLNMLVQHAEQVRQEDLYTLRLHTLSQA